MALSEQFQRVKQETVKISNRKMQTDEDKVCPHKLSGFLFHLPLCEDSQAANGDGNALDGESQCSDFTLYFFLHRSDVYGYAY